MGIYVKPTSAEDKLFTYQVDEHHPESLRGMRDLATLLLDRLEETRAPLAATGAPERDPEDPAAYDGGAGRAVSGQTPADDALEVLYADGTERLGSLWFLEAALSFPQGQGYTILEIATELEVEPAEARAYRRNLGRALRLAVEPIVANVPDFFTDRWDSAAQAYRYEVTNEIREAARRRGLI